MVYQKKRLKHTFAISYHSEYLGSWYQVWYGMVWYLTWTDILPGYAGVFTTLDVSQQNKARFQRDVVFLHAATCVHLQLVDGWKVLCTERATTSLNILQRRCLLNHP